MSSSRLMHQNCSKGRESCWFNLEGKLQYFNLCLICIYQELLQQNYELVNSQANNLF